MPLDPAIFTAMEKRMGIKLPPDGARIRWTAKDGRTGEHEVLYVWLAEDSPVIKLKEGPTLFPEFGDTYEVVDDHPCLNTGPGPCSCGR